MSLLMDTRLLICPVGAVGFQKRKTHDQKNLQDHGYDLFQLRHET